MAHEYRNPLLESASGGLDHRLLSNVPTGRGLHGGQAGMIFKMELHPEVKALAKARGDPDIPRPSIQKKARVAQW